MQKSIDLFIKKLELKRVLFDETNKKLEDLKNQKDNLTEQEFQQKWQQIEKEYEQQRNAIMKLKQ